PGLRIALPLANRSPAGGEKMNPRSSSKIHQLGILLGIGLRNLWRRPLYFTANLYSFIFLAVIVTSLFSLRAGLIGALES
ncbi:hypothetical protein, partial [Raoultella planticola]